VNSNPFNDFGGGDILECDKQLSFINYISTVGRGHIRIMTLCWHVLTDVVVNVDCNK